MSWPLFFSVFEGRLRIQVPEGLRGVRSVLGLCCAKFGNSFPSIFPLYFSLVSFLDWSDMLLGGAGFFKLDSYLGMN